MAHPISVHIWAALVMQPVMSLVVLIERGQSGLLNISPTRLNITALKLRRSKGDPGFVLRNEIIYF
jgi:hypothetical protein